MADPDRLTRLKALIKAQTFLDAPAVDPLEPVIRSGDQFLLRDPLKGRAADAGRRERLAKKLDKIAGNLVVEWGYDVPAKDHERFARWLEANEDYLIDHAPMGVWYGGTYAVFSTTEKNSGQYRTIWSYQSYADLDKLSDEIESGSRFAQLVTEMTSFRDTTPGAGRSQQVYQLAAGARRLDAGVPTPGDSPGT